MNHSSLFQKLKEHAASDIYPYHMPGHKRNTKITDMASYYDIDITEIDGFDNLHAADGILKQVEEKAASLYQATKAKMLINGSTVGVLASILGCTRRGDTILVARNCHKSVYHAAYMNELDLLYLSPEVVAPWNLPGSISPEQIQKKLDENPECRVVVITSPTYEGIVLPVREIAKVVHAAKGILIVDSAHGAHLGFSCSVAPNVIQEGADIAIVSLHKTLPAMTQTSLLLYGAGFKETENIDKYLRMLQSSSPSYVLMASIETALNYMEEQGDKALSRMVESLKDMCDKVSGCKHIGIAGTDLHGKYAFKKGNWDPGKIVIYSKDESISGQELYDCLLNEYHLQMELATDRYVLAMFTVSDTTEAYERLSDAILNLEKQLEAGRGAEGTVDCQAKGYKRNLYYNTDSYGNIEPYCNMDNEDVTDYEKDTLPKVVLPIYRALDARYEMCNLAHLQEGMVVADFINIYPPGTPIYVPGEALTKAGIEQIKKSKKMGLNLQGVNEDWAVKIVK